MLKKFKKKAERFIIDHNAEIFVGEIITLAGIGFILAGWLYDSGYKNGCSDTAEHFVKTIGKFYRGGQVIFIEKGTNRVLDWDAAGGMMFGRL